MTDLDASRRDGKVLCQQEGGRSGAHWRVNGDKKVRADAEGRDYFFTMAASGFPECWVEEQDAAYFEKSDRFFVGEAALTRFNSGIVAAMPHEIEERLKHFISQDAAAAQQYIGKALAGTNLGERAKPVLRKLLAEATAAAGVEPAADEDEEPEAKKPKGRRRRSS